MIEVNVIYDFLPGINQEAYAEFAKKSIGTMLQAPGFVEFRANRNILGSPKVRITTVWQSLSDWAKFSESTAWQTLELELHSFTTNNSTEIWGQSPLVPEPLRPGS